MPNSLKAQKMFWQTESHTLTKKNSFLDFKILKQEFPQLESSRQFHLAPELLSEIFRALCAGKAGDMTLKVMTGHFEQGKNSLQNSAKTFT